MRAQVIKNRLVPPMRHADFELYFESGIDDDGIETMPTSRNRSA